MRTIEQAVKKTIGILALSAMLPVAAWAAGAPAAPKGGFQGPPPQAFDACAGKKAGDTVQFTTPRGDNVTAVCREFDGKLAARPMRGPGGAGYHRGMGMGHGMMGMGFGMDNCLLSGKLNLTAEQKTKIQAVMTEERDKSIKLHEQMMGNRDKFREAVHKMPYDEAAVRKLADEQGALHSAMMVSHAGAMNRALSILTPEQRQIVEKEGFCGRGAGWGRGMGPGAGRGQGAGKGRGMGNPDCPWR